MNTNRLAVGFAMVLLMVVASGRAEALELTLSGSLDGTFVSTPIDTNGDGTTATLGLGTLSTALGKFTVQNVAEFLFPLAAPVICPTDNVEFPFLLNTGIITSGLTGDQIFFEFFTGTLCFDPTTGIGTASGAGNITGGTGLFEGATGTLTGVTTVTHVLFDSAGNMAFGSRNGTAAGTLITP